MQLYFALEYGFSGIASDSLTHSLEYSDKAESLQSRIDACASRLERKGVTIRQTNVTDFVADIRTALESNSSGRYDNGEVLSYHHLFLLQSYYKFLSDAPYKIDELTDDSFGGYSVRMFLSHEAFVNGIYFYEDDKDLITQIVNAKRNREERQHTAIFTVKVVLATVIITGMIDFIVGKLLNG